MSASGPSAVDEKLKTLPEEEFAKRVRESIYSKLKFYADGLETYANKASLMDDTLAKLSNLFKKKEEQVLTGRQSRRLSASMAQGTIAGHLQKFEASATPDLHQLRSALGEAKEWLDDWARKVRTDKTGKEQASLENAEPLPGNSTAINLANRYTGKEGDIHYFQRMYNTVQVKLIESESRPSSSPQA